MASSAPPGSATELLYLELCQCLARGVVSVVVLIKVYGKLDIVDVVFEPEEDCWVYRYHVNRKLLMFLDRVFDILVFGLFILYHLKSIPHRPVCFVICILSRLISSALYSNTKNTEMLRSLDNSSYNSNYIVYNSIKSRLA